MENKADMSDKSYFACYIREDEGLIWYAFGEDYDSVKEGLSEYDNAHVVPCTASAFNNACHGLWGRLAIATVDDEDETVVSCPEGESNVDCMNTNPPVVKALVAGRDLTC